MPVQSKQIHINTVEAAIRTAINHYFDNCQKRVAPFIQRNFQYPGAWHTNKPAFGWDLLRAPFNLFWAPIYLCSQILAWVFRQVGLKSFSRAAQKVPGGLTTKVQLRVATLITSDLLFQSGHAPCNLKALILEALDNLIESDIKDHELLQKLDQAIEQALIQYGLTRTASADITNSLLSALVGTFAFQKFTPGGIAIGLLLASWLAQQYAIDHFILGNFLGTIYYDFFPTSPSLGINILSIAVVLAGLAVLASLSGLITDPIQSWTGLHQYRLKKMLKHLQKDMQNQSGNSFSPKDPYLARILELLDAAKSQLA